MKTTISTQRPNYPIVIFNGEINQFIWDIMKHGVLSFTKFLHLSLPCLSCV